MENLKVNMHTDPVFLLGGDWGMAKTDYGWVIYSRFPGRQKCFYYEGENALNMLVHFHKWLRRARVSHERRLMEEVMQRVWRPGV